MHRGGQLRHSMPVSKARESCLDLQYMMHHNCIMNTLSSSIRAIRAQLQLSQADLAHRLGVSLPTISRWEAGKSKPQGAQQAKLDKLLAQVDQAGAVTHPAASEEPERRRRGLSRSSVLGTRSMEQMLWDAACSIRGEKDAPKFKDYLLPLLFIKRLSDVFDDELNRLTEQYGDRDTAVKVVEADAARAADPAKRLVRFYLPPEARWPVVSGRMAFKWPAARAPKTLGEQLTTTIRAIVKHNPSLAGVIDTIDYNETRNGEREISDGALKGVIETFSDPRYRLGLRDVEPDFLGRCYEYLLRKFAEGSGQSAGEFFTPTEVGFLMAEMIRPRPGEEAYDYACGSFGLLIKLQLVGRRLDPLSKVPLRLYGQELTGSSYAVACMNKVIHDMQGEVLRGDSMRNPKFRDRDGKLKQFDIVVANPMWNQPFDRELFENDPFDRFEPAGGVTTGKGDWAWLQHTLASLKPGGRAAVVLDAAAVTRGSQANTEDRERAIRRWFIERDLIDGVVLLPDNIFYNTPAAGIILLLRKDKPANRRGRITLIDGSREFRKGNPKNYLDDEGSKRIADSFAAGVSVDEFAVVLSIEEVAKADYNLAPARHVRRMGGVPALDPSVIAKQLTDLRRRSNALFAEISADLGAEHGS